MPPSYQTRRKTIQMVGTVMTGTLAGCNSWEKSDSTLPESPTKSTEEDTSPVKQSSTDSTRKTTKKEIEQRYRFGEWHSDENWRMTVTSLSLKSTFGIDGEEMSYQMPDNEQLAIATLKIENTASTMDQWPDGGFVFVLDESNVIRPQMDFSHPEFENDVNIVELQRVQHADQQYPEGMSVESGETRKLWHVSVVSRDIRRENVQIGYSGIPIGGNDYPIRWINK